MKPDAEKRKLEGSNPTSSALHEAAICCDLTNHERTFSAVAGKEILILVFPEKNGPTCRSSFQKKSTGRAICAHSNKNDRVMMTTVVLEFVHSMLKSEYFLRTIDKASKEHQSVSAKAPLLSFFLGFTRYVDHGQE